MTVVVSVCFFYAGFLFLFFLISSFCVFVSCFFSFF